MNDPRNTLRFYEWLYILLLLLVLALSITFLRPQRLGMVDMDRVIKATGMWDRIQKAMREREAAAQAKLDALQKRFLEEDRAILARLKENTSEEEKAALQAQLMQHQREFIRERSEAGEELQRFHRNALLTFRERVRPAVIQSARRRRLDLVLEPTEVFEVLNRGIDLTDDVIARVEKEDWNALPLVEESLLSSRNLLPVLAPRERTNHP